MQTSDVINRKILLVSYHFPPSTAVGGFRLANFTRGLADKGWAPLVLTIQDRYLNNIDGSRMPDLADARIFKTAKLPTFLHAYAAAKSFTGMLAKRGQKSTPPSKAQSIVTYSSYKHAHRGESALHRMKRYAFSLLLALPDFERNWLIPSVHRALQIVRKHSVDVLLTSCPPYSTHLIGLLVSRMTGVAWIADFRDPWITGSQKRLFFTCRWSMSIEKWMEKQVVQSARMVITNTRKLRETLTREYDSAPNGHFQFIPNGFDPSKFVKLRDRTKRQVFTMTYAGSLYFGRSPEPIFSALKALLDEKSIKPADVRLNLIGHCDVVEGEPTVSVLERYGLGAIVNIQPPIPYEAALEMIAESHIALLFAPDQPFQIPAKVYDYLGSGTPILALAGEGATADFIRETCSGNTFSPSDIEGIKAHLKKCIVNPEQTLIQPSADALEHYNTNRIAGKLSSLLSSLYV